MSLAPAVVEQAQFYINVNKMTDSNHLNKICARKSRLRFPLFISCVCVADQLPCFNKTTFGGKNTFNDAPSNNVYRCTNSLDFFKTKVNPCFKLWQTMLKWMHFYGCCQSVRKWTIQTDIFSEGNTGLRSLS